MNTYRLYINSNKRAIISSILSLAFLMSFFFLVTDRDTNINLMLAIFAFGLLGIYAISFSLSLGIMEVEVTKDDIRFRWKKRFLFSKEKDYHIPFIEILHYQHEHVPQYEWIKLILTDNRQFVLSRLAIPTSYRKLDQFSQFVRELPIIMEKGSESNNVNISEGPTIYDHKGFRWLLYIVSAISLFMIYDVLTNPFNSNSWPKVAWITFNIFYLLIHFRRVKN